MPFTTSEQALENTKMVNDCELSPELESFLNEYFPKSKSDKNKLGCVDKNFSQKISEILGIKTVVGEFLVEILPYIDFNLIKKNPKYICGFSDPTGLLYPITTKCDIATIYGSNFSSFGDETFYQPHYDFLNIITGEKLSETSYELYEVERPEKVTGLEGLNLTEKVCWKTLDNKKAEFTGRIIGGCFDIIAELAGTKYDGIDKFNEKYKNEGIIWYFDNCELSMEETIRVLWKFNELGYFKYAKGVIFGRFGVETTYFDYDVKSCLKDSVLGELNIPVIYDADISHKAPSITIINGSIAHVECSRGKGKIDFKLK